MDADRTPPLAWRFDRFTLDLARGALLGPDGAEVPLRPKSLALLRLLVENPGRIVDRDAIMAAVWLGVIVTDESITQCIRDVRKALDDEAQQMLKTVPKRGYLLAAEVTPAETTAPAPRVERRLAAILAADIVGYSRLVEQDEAATLAAIKGLREQAIDPLLAEHKGRIVKLMGDGAIVEFASVVDAVACAVAVQKAVADRQAKTPADRRIVFRIGVNLGDVVVEADDLLGDGVNVAARLEQLCEPGGVLLSGTAYDHLQGRLGLPLDFTGEQQFKNIARLVRVYRVRLDGVAPRHAGRSIGEHRWLGAAAVVLLLAAGAGGWWWLWPSEPVLAAQASIAVLPLTNLSGDPRWERLADGISEDIITDLARRPDLFVIGRNSTFIYKGKSVDVKQVGRELGVRYVLEGSIQGAEDRVRITAQLIDAATGAHVWAERYDRPIGKLFATQDEITRQIAGKIGGWTGRLANAVRAEARRKAPGSLEAYELYLIGLEQNDTFTLEQGRQAIATLRRAVELDPGYARGWAALGLAYSSAALNGFVDDPLAAIRFYKEYTKKAVALDPADPLARANLGLVRALEGDLNGASAEYQATLTLAPNDADILALLGWFMAVTVGPPEEAIRHVEHAIALNPTTPPWYFGALGVARYLAGSYEAAIEALKRAPPGGEPFMFLVLAEAMAGRAEAAREHAAQLRRESPSLTVEGYIRDSPVTAPEAQAKIREGAAKAGLIEAGTN